MDLGRDYDQYGIILHKPSKDTKFIVLKDDEGNILKGFEVGDQFSKMVLGKAQFYSTYQGNPFHFA